MAPTPGEGQASTSRFRWLLGTLLALVTLTWLLYPLRPLEKAQVLHRDPVSYQCGDDETVRNVAIIGAGSAGASAAYYLKKLKSPCQQVNITVYERNHYVGGRSTTVNAYDDPTEPVELGASIFVKVNHNLVNAAQAFSLPVQGMQATRRGERPETLGVWNGEQFVFTQSDGSNQYWNIAKLLWKYGYSPIRTQNLMKKTVGSFLRMYNPPYFPFISLSETAFKLDLIGATAATGQQFLETNGISEHFRHDIIQASTRVNYAQNLDQIHGLESMVCMATDGAMSIRGGNWQIFDGMVKSSGATVFLNTSVTSITKNSTSGKYSVRTKTPLPENSNDGVSDLSSSAPFDYDSYNHGTSYDTIIIASPLQFANISFTPPLSNPPPAIPYVSLHVTLFTSPYRLSPTYFDIPRWSLSSMPDTILTTTSPNDKSIPFFSISTLRTVHPPLDWGIVPRSPPDDVGCGTRDVEYLYKIFSPAPLNTTFIHSLLDLPSDSYRNPAITWFHHMRWDSYPYLPPRITFEDLRLDGDADGDGEQDGRGVWYTSGIESFISTMETSSLMGSNVAKLVLNGYKADEARRTLAEDRMSNHGEEL